MEATEPTTYIRHEGDKRRHADLGKPVPTGRRQGVRHPARNRPFARFTSGTPTGTTPHFTLWMKNAGAISALLRLKTIDLAEGHPNAKTASAYACVYGGGIHNIYQLSQTREQDLLKIKGIGPAAVDRLRADLKTRNVYNVAF